MTDFMIILFTVLAVICMTLGAVFMVGTHLAVTSHKWMKDAFSWLAPATFICLGLGVAFLIVILILTIGVHYL